MTKYPTESTYRKERLTDSQCRFFVLGGHRGKVRRPLVTVHLWCGSRGRWVP